MPASKNVKHGRALDVKNPSFLLERMGKDCGDEQFLRELTHNSLQALEHAPAGAPRRIVWDARDWHGQRKLAIYDTGSGMSAEQMLDLIAQLASSTHEQSVDANMGIGSKIAAASRNPHGLVYESWHGDQANAIRMLKRPADWGLAAFDWPDGTTHDYLQLDYDARPDHLAGAATGTVVTMLGNNESHDTTIAPTGVKARRDWIARYLNRRYLDWPDDIELLVREGLGQQSDEPGGLIRIRGQRHYLDQQALASGRVALTDADVHWWLLTPRPAPNSKKVPLWEAFGHAAALSQSEIYNMPAAGNKGAYQRVQEFGVRFGPDRVVLYVEPHRSVGSHPDISRTFLSIAGDKELPWARWAKEFREQMPDPIRVMQEELVAAAVTSSDQRATVRSRISSVAALYRLSRYRAPRVPAPRSGDRPEDLLERAPDPYSTAEPNKTGGAAKVEVTSPVPPTPTLTAAPDPGPEEAPNPPTLTPQPAHLVAVPAPPPLVARPHTRRRRAASAYDDAGPAIPDVRWVSVHDGTRAPGDLEDRAARYDADGNVIYANRDFRVYEDMVARWLARYPSLPGARRAIEAVVLGWFETVLIEGVLGALAVQDSPHWSDEERSALLSPEGLTMSVTPRLLMDERLKKQIAQLLGKSTDEPAVASDDTADEVDAA